ncbi:MAG: SPOR domain-containing protein [Comamonadaceae bacterium]|nr:SPOR domain-containing protein [Comamonadaceae bacterium]
MNPHTQETAEQATSGRSISDVHRLRASRGRYQSGGTFLGVILGVMAGLAVALGVAIYVAKVPVPFVNKGSTRTSGQDAAEAEKNKDWDPNSALRGRAAGAGRPAAPAVSGVVASEPAPQVIPTPQIPAPAVVAPAPAEVKPPTRTAEKPAAAASAPTPRAPAATRAPSADPLGDLAAARAGSTSQAVDPFTYFVQAGAFRNDDDAQAQRARLSLMGVESRVTEREQAGRTVYRVRVGPFQNKDAADRVKERLDGNGFDSALVRVQK